MGIYSEYLDRNFAFEQLVSERKKQLQRISDRRKRDVLVFAADLDKGQAPISINYPDLLPIKDQLSNLSGETLDLILETPGGSGEAAEDIIRVMRSKFRDIAVIVPGWAKSAGTIMAMAADDILMEPGSALGPIDAQLFWQGKVFSADALLEGFDKIKREVEETGVLNKAYIPILQGISPGELQNAQNARQFAEELVTKWLAKYKFKNWIKHSSTGAPVIDEEREQRAKEIACRLRDHSSWLSHGRSIKIDDLRAMKLHITDYSQDTELADAIRRYHTLLQMTFATNIYKVFETPTSQIYKFIAAGNVPLPSGQDIREVEMDVMCNECKTHQKVHARFQKGLPVKLDAIPFPLNNKLKCPKCNNEMDLSDIRRQLEAQSQKPIVE
jgi:hypothetical protein